MTAAHRPAGGTAGAGGPPVPGWLTGIAASLAAAPVPPLLAPPPSAGRRSAVLVLFGHGALSAAPVPGPAPAAPGGPRVPGPAPAAPGTAALSAPAPAAPGQGDDPDLLLIQRMPGLRRHGGQPAFPGGAIDPADEGPVQAALREAAEEVGVDPAGVDVVGTGPELYISRSGFRVTPVLGWWRRPVAISPADPAEVAATARVPISALADPANRLTIRHPSGHAGPAFRVSGMLVWGFTAGLIDMLLTLGGWQRPWETGRLEDLPAEALEAAIPRGARRSPALGG